eukprot:14691851-Heterocapsa_arctica.AAC.1
MLSQKSSVHRPACSVLGPYEFDDCSGLCSWSFSQRSEEVGEERRAVGVDPFGLAVEEAGVSVPQL